MEAPAASRRGGRRATRRQVPAPRALAERQCEGSIEQAFHGGGDASALGGRNEGSRGEGIEDGGGQAGDGRLIGYAFERRQRDTVVRRGERSHDCACEGESAAHGYEVRRDKDLE